MNDKEIDYKYLFELIKTHKYILFKKQIEDVIKSNDMFDINVKDDNYHYFLTYAVLFNQIDLVKFLVDNNAKIDIVDKYDRSILFDAINHSYYEIIELLLELNKNTIGVSILDTRDRDMRIPLHYAIENQNVRIVKLLLEYGSNVNITDRNGYNSLHLAVKSRNYSICEYIIDKIADVNSRYKTGESALHIACNLQLVDIVKLLIKYNIDTNIKDYDNEITPLHYAVLLKNIEICVLLLKTNIYINTQDVYGNTPLHYAVMEDYFEIFTLLTSHSNSINYNLWNIEGDIIGHLILKTKSDRIFDYLNIILDKTNVSLQDNKGNTCLHYLIKDNIWEQYYDVLVRKRLDIFVRDSTGKLLIDLVEKDKYEKFINMVIESYLYRLRNRDELWYYQWENICSKKFNDLTNKDIKDLGIENNINAFDSKCKNIIKDKLFKLLDDVKNGVIINCYDKSFPMKRAIMCIDVNEGTKLDQCTFTGSTLDVLIGLIYLLNKHKNTCSTLSKDFSQNTELCSFYKSIGIIMNSKCEFLNFEIVWVHQKLYLTKGFYEEFKKCIDNNKRFIIIPLGIELREGSHAGYLIYDHEKKEVERFEPHGSTIPIGLYYNPSQLDELLETRFKRIDKDIKYIRPSEYLPKIGFQIIDVSETKRKRIGDPAGFCALWSIWYVDMRLTYTDIDRGQLVKILIDNIKSKNISFKNMIRNYATDIINIRNNIFNKSQMDINDWLNDQYTDEQINNVLVSLVEEIEKIN